MVHVQGSSDRELFHVMVGQVDPRWTPQRDTFSYIFLAVSQQALSFHMAESQLFKCTGWDPQLREPREPGRLE